MRSRRFDGAQLGRRREAGRGALRAAGWQLLLAVLLQGWLAAAAAAQDRLDGLWGAEKVFTPAAPIQVSITREAAQDDQPARLKVHALGQSAPVVVSGGTVRFELPHGLGAFRGTRTVDGAHFVGHWIAPPATLAYSHYASPLTLRSVTPNLWRGEVVPFPQRFRVYLAIEQGGQNVLFINPERNEGRFNRIAKLERDGPDLRFLNRAGDLVARGHYDQRADVLQLALPWRGGTYDLTRRSRNSADGYFPRREASYRYASPPALDDGWPVADAAAQGMARDRLSALVRQILDAAPAGPRIHALLVAHRGTLVFEEYFYGYHRDLVHDSRSASKSLTGLMVGQMLAETPDIDLDTALPTLFPRARLARDARRGVTLEHLLSMRSGFHCDDNDEASPGNEDRMQSQDRQLDWRRYTLSLPMANAPGTRGVYCSGAINLLGGVISEATGVWLPEFFRSRLAQPLGIDTYYMNLDPLTRGYAGGGLHLRPRDALKFAQLMVDQGRWQSRQVVPADWVRRSAQPFASVNSSDDYGLTWWRNSFVHEGRELQALSATGNGGQLLIAVPALQLAVVFTGGNYGEYRVWSRWRDQLLPEYILPALVR